MYISSKKRTTSTRFVIATSNFVFFGIYLMPEFPAGGFNIVSLPRALNIPLLKV